MKRTPFSRLLISMGILLNIFYLPRLTMTLINYHLTVSNRLQESRDEITAVGVA